MTRAILLAAAKHARHGAASARDRMHGMHVDRFRALFIKRGAQADACEVAARAPTNALERTEIRSAVEALVAHLDSNWDEDQRRGNLRAVLCDAPRNARPSRADLARRKLRDEARAWLARSACGVCGGTGSMGSSSGGVSDCMTCDGTGAACRSEAP